MRDTIEGLIRAEAVIFWRCEVCGAQGRVDLAALRLRLGPAFSLANRRPSCRLCPGRVLFEDRGRVFIRRLDTIGDHSPAGWAYHDAERARLYALGWRVVMGKWTAPDDQTTGEDP